MTETSFFWDGITVGDATDAPYNDDEIATALGNVIGDFVIPFTYSGTGRPSQELHVALSATIGKVDVLAGAAFVKGVMYVLDATAEVDIASNASGNPRIDIVILRRSSAGQTVRLTVVQGTPAAAPSPPALTITTDMSLAWIWVEDGYDAGVDTIDDEEIHDERVFREIGPSHQLSARKNLIPNAEFFGVSGVLSAGAPDKWSLVLTPGLGENLGTYRGRHLTVTSIGGGEGVETTVSCNQVFTTDPVFTISGYVNCTQGEFQIWVYRVNLSTGVSTLERIKKFRTMSASGFTQFTIREQIVTEEDAIRIQFIGGTGGTDILRMGDLVLNKGYMPVVPYNHEVIWFDYPITDASWTATAKSTGLTTINLVSNFGSVILPYIRGVILRVRCKDSASAAAATFGTAITLHHALDSPPSTTTAVGIVSCAGRPNDTWEEQVVFVPVDNTDANAPIKVYVYASGAGTLDATIEIIGMVT
jgi:hypothetical protein